MTSEIGARVSRAVIWSGVNSLITRAVNIVMTAITVRLVTPTEFGTYAVALTVFTVISGFSELGLSTCLARKDMEPDQIGSTVSFLSLVSAVVLAGAMVLFARPLAVVLGAPDAAASLRVLSLCVLMVGIFAVPVGLITREFRQDAVFIATFVSFIPSSVVLIVLALHGDGALAFAWSRVVGQVVMGVLLFYFAQRSYWPRAQWRHLRVVLTFALPVAGATLIRYVLLNADYLFVGRLLGPAALGVYMLAFNVGSWATSVLFGVINSVAMPAFSHESSDPARLRASLRQSTELVSLIAFPIAGLTLVLADPIIRILYGEKWLAAVPVLEILGVYGALFVLTLLLGNLLVGVGLSGRMFLLQCVWLVALIPVMAGGVTLAGLKGAAGAHIAVLVVVVLPVHLVLISRRVPGASGLIARAVMRPVILAAVVSLVAWLVAALFQPAPLRLLAGSLTAGVVYVLIAFPLLRPLVPAGMSSRLRAVLGLYDRTVGRVVTPLLHVPPGPEGSVGAQTTGDGGEPPPRDADAPRQNVN